MKKINICIAVTSLFALFSSCNISAAYSDDVDYRREMADFVKEISSYSKKRTDYFAVIPQNGQELSYSDYLDAIDGTGREDLFYGYDGDNVATGKEESEYMIELCDVYKNAGKTVLVTDYCTSSANQKKSYEKNKDRGYISFAAPERGLNVIPADSYCYNKNNSGIEKLSDVKNFLYLINSENYDTKELFITALEKTDYDLLIIDLFCEDGMLSKVDVERLKVKKNGSKRLVVCYMSIGEAEDYRYYWEDGTVTENSSFVMEENPNWEGNYKVQYWNPNWKKIIYGSKNSYLDKILASGFDGVYLDIIDAFEYFENK